LHPQSFVRAPFHFAHRSDWGMGIGCLMAMFLAMLVDPISFHYPFWCASKEPVKLSRDPRAAMKPCNVSQVSFRSVLRFFPCCRAMPRLSAFAQPADPETGK
jgi:hypothetical protein